MVKRIWRIPVILVILMTLLAGTVSAAGGRVVFRDNITIHVHTPPPPSIQATILSKSSPDIDPSGFTPGLAQAMVTVYSVRNTGTQAQWAKTNLVLLGQTSAGVSYGLTLDNISWNPDNPFLVNPGQVRIVRFILSPSLDFVGDLTVEITVSEVPAPEKG